MELSKKEDDYFPHLNLNLLKEFAKRIVNNNKELPIINITLYRYHSAFNFDVPQKYAIIIVINSNMKSSPEQMELLETLHWATANFQTLPDPDSSRYLGIDAGFEDIYRENAPQNFRREWVFCAITSDEGMPLGIMVKEKNIILYQQSSNKK